MPVVTTRAASQNGGLATVVVGSAAPTGSGLDINAQQLPLGVVFPLDLWPPSFSSPASRANDRNSVLLCIIAILPDVLFLRSSARLPRLRDPLAFILIPLVAFPCLPVSLGRACALAGARTRRRPHATSPPLPELSRGYK